MSNNRAHSSLKNKNNDNHKNIAEQCGKLIEVFEGKKTTNIIDNFLGDYRTIMSEIEQVYKKDKNESLGKNESIFVEKENSQGDPPISLKIVDNYHCFLDVLNEVCRYNDFSPYNYVLKEKKNLQEINLTMPVMKYLEKNSEKNFILAEKSGENNISKDNDKEKNKNFFVNKNEENNLNVHKDSLNLIEKNENYQKNTTIIDEELYMVENNLINKFWKITLFLVLLCIVFVYYMTQFKIQQRYYIDQAVKNDIFKNYFYQMNKYGLNNAFANIENAKSLERWFLDSYPSMFIFGKIFYFILLFI